MSYRSPELVVEELKYLKNRYSINSFSLWDEIQFLNKKWVSTFSDVLIRENVNLKWSVVSRVTLFKESDYVDDLDLMRFCKKAGLLRITVGIESGNQNILDAMDKGQTVEQVEYSIRLIRDAGIKATGSMLVGYPGETPDTIRDSINFANRNLLKTSFYCLIPLPGTGLYERCVGEGIIQDENKYLETISEHGDASHIYINVTKMSDNQYKTLVEEANKLVSSVPFSSFLHYYGVHKGFFELIRQNWTNTKLAFRGKIFETP